METPFKKYLFFSLLLHGLLLGIFSLCIGFQVPQKKSINITYLNLSPKKGLSTGSSTAPAGIRNAKEDLAPQNPEKVTKQTENAPPPTKETPTKIPTTSKTTKTKSQKRHK
ncbi:MAG: hypothetical protein KDK66_05105, partial [Deltaproteobacteria bacterium]|nr:hypothetical protein [Deltaproteobacteria bacterium]